MQQTFQCYRCGAQNYMGQVFCWNCNERFLYYCPWCNVLVDATLPNCPNCRVALPWQAQQQPAPGSNYPQSQEEDQYEEEAGKPANKAPLIIAAACLVLIAVIVLAVIYLPGMFKQSGQQTPATQSQLNQPKAPTDNKF